MSQANTILGWHEALMPDDVPPQWMWHLDDELADWFDMVKEKHDARRNGENVDDREEVPLWENELAKGRG